MRVPGTIFVTLVVTTIIFLWWCNLGLESFKLAEDRCSDELTQPKETFTLPSGAIVRQTQTHNGNGGLKHHIRPKRWTPPPCELIPELVAKASHDHHHDPWTINELRRNLSLAAPSCLSQHFDLFAAAFLSRPRHRHLTLHLPKTGGTSLCKIVKDRGVMTSNGRNCWTGEFCPLWCGCTDPKPTTCTDLSQNEYDFVMNENWLDGFCDDDVGRVYSIMLREPVSRAISHVNHLLDALAARGHEHFRNTKGWRLTLAQSNYITWSLVAHNRTEPPSLFRPREEHLQEAEETLRKMDFILDLSFPNPECNAIVLELMGITESSEGIGRSNSYKKDYKKYFDWESYESMNALDVQLYQYATTLIEADCKFFLHLVNMNSSLLATKDTTREKERRQEKVD
jgi:hypothetical protein